MWSDWKSCSRTCGGGTWERTRMCMNINLDEEGCIGEPRESGICNENPCRKT